MTISLFTGTPGSGKSLRATARIRDSLSYKKPVIANYSLSEKVKGYKYFTYVPNEELTADFLVEYAKNYWSKGKKFKEDHILLVIDECQLLFNSREWQSNNRMEWIKFYSQHRKLGFEIILVAQFDRMLDRQMRSLVEYEVMHRELGNFGIKGKIMAMLTGGKLFVAIRRYYPLNERVGVQVFKARKNIFRMYDSYAAFERKKEDKGKS